MKILSRTIILLIITSAFVSFGVSSVAASDVSLDAFEPKAGDTVWYTADSFFLDLEFLSNGELNDTYTTTTLDLSNSQVFAKVMNVKTTTGTIYDPDTSSSNPGTSKIVDLATGVILGKDVTYEYNDLTTVFPKGIGMPIPSIFQSFTEFGFTPSDYTSGFFPLFLNDNWDDHEAFVSSTDPDVIVTNDNAQFKIETTNPYEVYDPETGTFEKVADTTISVAWDKSNNVISSAVLKVSSSTQVYVDIDIRFSEIKNNGLDLEVGDVFKIALTTGVFDVTLEGNAYSEDAQSQINMIKSELADATSADMIMEIIVDDIDGLYYLTTINAYNSTTDSMEFVAAQWFAGFGNVAFSYYLSAGSDMLNQVVPTGPATTPDNYVWGSWDKTVQFLYGVLETQFDVLVQTATDEALADPDVVQFDLTATLDLSHTVSTSNGYSVTSTGSISIQSVTNRTMSNTKYEWNGTDIVEVNSTGWNYFNLDLSLNSESSYSYDVRGRLSSLSMSLTGYIDYKSMSYEMTLNNDNLVEVESSNAGKIVINKIELKIETNFTPVSPETGPPTNNPDALADTAQNPLPGFELFFALGAVAVIAIAFRKRKA